MTKPFRIAVFASGSGSNFQAIADAVNAGRLAGDSVTDSPMHPRLDVRIELLVCDRPKAQVVERARQLGVPAFVFRPKDYADRETYEKEILERLQALEIDLVVMAGYMRLITNVLVEPLYGRLINIHPSLLPSFPGLDAIKQALDYGVKVTGVTVHYVDGGMDTGPIIAQRSVEITPQDTEESLAARIHEIEHVLLPQVIERIARGQVQLQGNITITS
ncbi:phosphoribosylglycinamide formyltransferase [Paenibacillus radicis (ex Xue et al. 2023)]|uniref:Phosphoribosylglycinamide formyltransferase n=1 Tax=Paenibacillus radicis (ex Xue et al. 2023) TaxID=2972489 RepID=A0ABT1YTB7_9BACL|nr:phosphoribosylglycinamide formyltransferase [Paenibacillus radicis (ex Xue et al. 2023)]MCR8636428.1 phosphoribosylglycinamide formyltransferase [Paenibacillus radicis (ex Xue et al. 2023)]